MTLAGRAQNNFAMLQVVNIPNSMTVLPELLPYSIEMVRHCTLSYY